MTQRMAVLLQIPLTGRGPSYTCGLLGREMTNKELEVTIVTPRFGTLPVSPAKVIEVLPRWTRYIPYRWLRSAGGAKLEAAFIAFAANPDSQVSAGYIFPDAKFETILQLKRAGLTVFREMINCHRGTAKVILDDAYKRLGLTPQHGITEESVILEQKALEAVDYIFCPSPMIEASLLENHVRSEKLLKASFGWDPGRFPTFEGARYSTRGLTAAFVGKICVRKGAHLLLEYWAQSGVKGQLVMAGELEPAIEAKCADLLRRKDVRILNYVQNVGAIYRSADVFAFPSLEEGDPLVTYEACGCGLPVITTPMGAGRVVRNNREGFVIDPYDRPGWISALRKLADDVDVRRKLANAATERSRGFVWSEVAERRRQQVLGILSGI